MTQLTLATSSALSIAATLNTRQSIGSNTSVTAQVAQLLRPLLSQLGAEVLQLSTQASTAGAAADASIILSQLLNPTNGALLMDVNLNQLLNNAVLQNVIKQLPPELLAKPQIFEAVVLQNILLPNSAANSTSATPALPNTSLANLPLLIIPTATSNSAPPTPPSNLYRVSVEWQNRIIELISPQPLPAGNRLQLQTTSRGELVLLATLAAKAPSLLNNASVSAPAVAPVDAQQQITQQALRELMPRQQPLTVLIPVLQKLSAPAIAQQLPAPIQKALGQLLQSLPKPEQMKTAEGVKHAVENSGNFLESRLLRASNPATPESPQRIIANDAKAQISTLMELIRRLTPASAGIPRTASAVDNDDLVYTQKPAVHASANNNPLPKNDSENLDTLLTQLSKLLQAGLARIQVNQLDSVSARHADANATAPTPTWVLELPLRTPFGADQLQVRIEQRQRKRGQQTRAQWNVQIALDLHDLGKLAATLAIVEKNVSATLWAEREQTHHKVQQHIDYLRAGLESVGVNVTEMRCRLGMPPLRKNPLSQRLVDVHT